MRKQKENIESNHHSHRIRTRKLTTLSLIFNIRNSTLLSPIDMIRQIIAERRRVPTALDGGEPRLPRESATQKPGPILLIGEIGETVQSHLITPRFPVMFINEPQIILENLKPPLLLAESVVSFSMVDQPRLVDSCNLLLSPLGGSDLGIGDIGDTQVVFRVFIDDGEAR